MFAYCLNNPVTGTVVAGTADAQATVNYAKQSKKSGKEKSSDKPSCVTQNDVDLSKSAQQNATELLDDKFGKGNWNKGPRSDFSRIVKWINRSLKVSAVFWYELFMED